MTKEEFRNKYNEIDNQLFALKQEYINEFSKKWGIVRDKLMKVVVKTAFGTKEAIGYIRFINVSGLGDFCIHLCPLKKNGEASKNIVNMHGEFIIIEKLKDE